jgi:hypothetical protein
MLIERLDRSIDRLVYDLYGLRAEEVKMVEESLGVNMRGCRGGRRFMV